MCDVWCCIRMHACWPLAWLSTVLLYCSTLRLRPTVHWSQTPPERWLGCTLRCRWKMQNDPLNVKVLGLLTLSLSNLVSNILLSFLDSGLLVPWSWCWAVSLPLSDTAVALADMMKFVIRSGRKYLINYIVYVASVWNAAGKTFIHIRPGNTNLWPWWRRDATTRCWT